MDAKHKMAIAGSGLVAAGIGLSIVGTALIMPAVFGMVMGMAEKGAELMGEELEHASRRVGTVAGTFRRSFEEATRAGVAEIKRGARKEHTGA